jgi:hypothetical protein
MDTFPFQFPEYLYGALIIWNVSVPDMVLLIHFQKISSKNYWWIKLQEKKLFHALKPALKGDSHLSLLCDNKCI